MLLFVSHLNLTDIYTPNLDCHSRGSSASVFDSIVKLAAAAQRVEQVVRTIPEFDVMSHVLGQDHRLYKIWMSEWCHLGLGGISFFIPLYLPDILRGYRDRICV